MGNNDNNKKNNYHTLQPVTKYQTLYEFFERQAISTMKTIPYEKAHHISKNNHRNLVRSSNSLRTNRDISKLFYWSHSKIGKLMQTTK